MTRQFLPLLAMALLLAACSDTPTRPGGGYEAYEPGIEAGPQMPPRQQVAEWLAEAEDSDPPKQQRLQLMAAELLLKEEQNDLAEELLYSINRGGIPYDLDTELNIALADVASRQGDFELVLSLLNEPRLQDRLTTMVLSHQLRASQLRAIAYGRSGDHLAAARERVFVHPLLDSDIQQANNDAIWSALTRLSADELKQHQRSLPEQDFRGWLELAAIAREYLGDLDVQATQIESWQRKWARHPAANPLPGGLSDIRQIAEQAPKQVALLLPFSGKLSGYGKSIRDGFLAAWYQANERGARVPTMRSYDTESASDIALLYDKAVADGAELIIGPLQKDKVAMLARARPAMPVPALALNRTPDTELPAKMFQFGLAPEDEARQIAKIAWGDGHSRALILAPRGRWGESVASSFATRWRELGGSVVSQGLFSASRKDYSSVVATSLNIKASKSRAQTLRNLLGGKFEFQPYRRTDVDFIFMLARPHEARAIKPLLAFHYAGDLPVYATSQIFSGSQKPGRDRDLEGLMFTEIPWLLANDQPLRNQIARHLPKSPSKQRFYAMGVDSFLLHPRLTQLLNFQHSRVFGNTGILRLDTERRITRELELARIVRGKPEAMAIADDGTGSGF